MVTYPTMHVHVVNSVYNETPRTPSPSPPPTPTHMNNKKYIVAGGTLSTGISIFEWGLYINESPVHRHVITRVQNTFTYYEKKTILSDLSGVPIFSLPSTYRYLHDFMQDAYDPHPTHKELRDIFSSWSIVYDRPTFIEMLLFFLNEKTLISLKK